MEIDIQLTPHDYTEFVEHTLAQARADNPVPFSVCATVKVLCLGLALGALYHFWSNHHQNDLVELKLSLFCFVMWGLARFGSQRILNSTYAKWALLPDGSFLQKTKILVSPECLMTEDSISTHHWKWSAIKRLSITKNLFCLYVDNTKAIVVPVRFFQTPEASDTFRALVMEHTNQRQSIEG